MTPRRFPPLYPGDVRLCPNGCPQRPPGYEHLPPPIMPGYAPACGYWYVCCVRCGWVARYVLRHGDRKEDIYWVTNEDVPAEEAAEARERMLPLRLKWGLGPWPVEEGVD